MDYEVKITCDGEKIPMNKYVKQVVGNVTAGLLTTLKRIDLTKETVISIKKKEK